jgi:hypothetical protein
MTRDEAIKATLFGYKIRHECWAPGWYLRTRIYNCSSLFDQWDQPALMPSFKEGWTIVQEQPKGPAQMPHGSAAWAKEQCDAGRTVTLRGAPFWITRCVMNTGLYVREYPNSIALLDWDTVALCSTRQLNWEVVK